MSVVRLFVAMPCLRQMEAQTALCLAGMLHVLGKMDGEHARVRRQGLSMDSEDEIWVTLAGMAVHSDSLLPRLRARLVDYAKAAEATHMLWIDSDMVFPADLPALLLRWDEPIVGCNCVRRKSPFLPTAIGKDGNRIWTTKEKADQKVLEEAKCLGFGVMLTSMVIFEDWQQPYGFEIRWDEAHGGRFVGEDIGFYLTLAGRGYEPKIDHEASYQIKHLGELEANWELANLQKVELDEEGVKY